MGASLRLFHVSKQSGIAIFNPGAAPSPDTGVMGDAVWAVDEDHLPNYLVPGDCPRVTFRVGSRSSPRDVAGFFDNTDARRMIVLEQPWLHRFNTAVLYIYEMPTAPFELADAISGYCISRHAVMPTNVREIREPAVEIMQRGYEIRYVPDPWPIYEGVVRSTLEYSIIGMRNAAPLN